MNSSDNLLQVPGERDLPFFWQHESSATFRYGRNVRCPLCLEVYPEIQSCLRSLRCKHIMCINCALLIRSRLCITCPYCKSVTRTSFNPKVEELGLIPIRKFLYPAYDLEGDYCTPNVLCFDCRRCAEYNCLSTHRYHRIHDWDVIPTIYASGWQDREIRIKKGILLRSIQSLESAVDDDRAIKGALAHLKTVLVLLERRVDRFERTFNNLCTEPQISLSMARELKSIHSFQFRCNFEITQSLLSVVKAAKISLVSNPRARCTVSRAKLVAFVRTAMQLIEEWDLVNVLLLPNIFL